MEDRVDGGEICAEEGTREGGGNDSKGPRREERLTTNWLNTNSVV